MRFINRIDAGQKLAKKLTHFKGKQDILVLGLPRGGVVLSAEVSKFLQIPMDILVARKIGAPSNPELAIGALTEGGTVYLNESLLQKLGLTVHDLTDIIEAEKKEALRRVALYRGNRPVLELKDKTVIIVDDGIATGSTMLVAVQKARALGAKKIVVAVPVSAADSLKRIEKEVDEVVCLRAPEDFFGVAQFYESFPQVTDDEVVELMR